jgi:hypothetical protein
LVNTTIQVAVTSSPVYLAIHKERNNNNTSNTGQGQISNNTLRETIQNPNGSESSLFWSKIAPYKSREGIVKGMIVGIALWTLLFVPLATFAIQPRLDSFAYSAPNQYIYNIAGHFKGLYAVGIGGSLVFHLIYGTLIGFISGRMTEIGIFVKTNKIAQQ